MMIWQDKTKPKCRFFVWLLILGKSLDNLLKKNWQCNPTCPLCFTEPEIVDHLLTECNFREVISVDAFPQRRYFGVESCN
jgi:hypothetical protein